MKFRVITEQLSNSNETDSDNDEMDLGLLDVKIMQLLNSDTEDKEFKNCARAHFIFWCAL